MVNWKTNAGPLPKGILIDSCVIFWLSSIEMRADVVSIPEKLSIYADSIESRIKSGVPVRSSVSGAGNRCQGINVLTRHRE